MILKEMEHKGIVPGQTFEDYKASDAVSHSDIKTFDVAPLKYLLYTGNDAPVKKSAVHLELGTIIHKFILQPELLETECLFLPEGVNLTHKKGRELKAEAEEKGLTLVRNNHAKIAAGVSRALMDNKTYGPFFYDGKAEVSVYQRFGGLACKGLIDWLPNTGGLFIDVKTVGRSCQPKAFFKQCEDLKYYRQFAMYRALLRLSGLSIKRVLCIVIETEPPYLMRMYEMPEQLLLAGEDEAKRKVEAIQQCMATQYWPGFDSEIIPCELPDVTPDWAYEKAGVKRRLLNR